MEAKETDAGELFAELQLRVPQWQRHYSWSKPEFTELWNDLERLLGEDQTSHFLGSVVLQMLPYDGMPNSVRTYWLVDGQQRAATLTILMCAIRDHIIDLTDGDSNREERFGQLTDRYVRNRDVSDEDTPRVKMQPRDHEKLWAIVTGTAERVSGSRMNEAYQFFREKLGVFRIAQTEKLIGIVTTRLKIVWVQLDGSDNAHRVFQTLNAGGKQLEQVDLIRNYFFLLLGQSGDDFYRTHWSQMESRLPQGQLRRYLGAWSISQGHFGTVKNLFQYFQLDLSTIESRPEEVLRYGRELADTSKLWLGLFDVENSSYPAEIKRTLIDLRNWRTEVADGILLWLVRLRDAGELNMSELHESLETILGYMARRIASGYEPNSHRPTLARLAMNAYSMKAEGRLETGQDVVDYLRFRLSRSEEIKIWPHDSMVRSNVRVANAYTTSRAHWTTVLLERANRALYEHPNHVPGPLPREGLSVEHVLPQRLNEAWTRDLESWGVQEPNVLHDEKLHVLGNLTITQINSDLGNRPFTEKAELLSDDPLKLNGQISSLNEWTGNTIDERSSRLANYLCQQFVGPVSEGELHALEERFGEAVDAEPDIDEDAIEDE